MEYEDILKTLQFKFRELSLKIMSDWEIVKKEPENFVSLIQEILKDFERLDKLYKAIIALQSLVEGE
jgi:hypothetical protein